MIIHIRFFAIALVAIGLAACGESEPGAGGSAEPAAGSSPAAGTGWIEGTPPGGLGSWIADIRAGLDSLPVLAAREPAAAKNEALLLYVGRQEYIEIYYGTTGRAVKDAALAEAVMTAEARFHDLLRTVNTPDGSVDAGALGSAAAALSGQYDRVLARAGELGVDTERLVLAGGGVE